MITKRIIPCLDVKNGRVVKGVNFQGLGDVASPVELAEYYSSCGADELAERVAMLDIDGSEAIQFMSCVRYGDRWYNRTPMSILAMIAGTETYSGGLVWQ